MTIASEQLAAASQIINREIEALKELESLPRTKHFSLAASAILYSKKVVVTGIGKSGWIGRKIAATFHSTGQPAVFMHPAEAAHGDMGLIESGDVVLILSNSGETDELNLIMRRCNFLDVQTITVTSNRNSRLAASSSFCLITPAGPEGCPINKAPMASSLCQLAVGDALAGALMKARDFSEEDFLEIHHGGYLGKTARLRLASV